ncbi:hypothetical protein, conserved [Eimeria brunetti]|uniref:Uncharacterized protein n=1 Tax=Eimeria brunetti TaxID=51314 RepID=U6LS14_9EIME|nr:hypothetical protein, conserved [Eimeria brunetti]
MWGTTLSPPKDPRRSFESSGGIWVSQATPSYDDDFLQQQQQQQQQQQRKQAFYTPPPPCPPTSVIPLKTNFYEPWGFSGPPGGPPGGPPSAADRRPKQYKTVFDRLTDSAFYTGTHRERFDEMGNGRGLAGREDLFAHDGMTESPSRAHEVYSSVIRRPRRALVSPGTLGVQRFGLQVSPPRLLWLFRNGDKHHDGVPFFVKAHIKTLDALYQELTKVLLLLLLHLLLLLLLLLVLVLVVLVLLLQLR